MQQLKEIDQVKSNEIASYFIDVKVNDGVPEFTYKLESGWSQIKLGHFLFNKEGLNRMLSK
ncbi:MAG: hypothetical protein ACXWCZ_11325 [Flavisolibacter sp.]